jgi:enamine deaminase RidA (YjgF/YER057c/UK114 family)
LPPLRHHHRAGPYVWVAGVVGQMPDGSIPSDVIAQFDRAIAVMDKCLEAAGPGPQHVVKVQAFMTDITERAASLISATTCRSPRWSR